VYFNVNFNILNQIGCALVGLIKDWITSECTAQLWEGGGVESKCSYCSRVASEVLSVCTYRTRHCVTFLTARTLNVQCSPN
jgi:hypothetical protein